MWDEIWENCTLVTLDPAQPTPYGLIADGAIAVREGKITWVGRRADLEDAAGIPRRDAEGYFLTPGFIDCHTHLVYSGSRIDEFEKRQQGMSYAEIAAAGGGILSTVRATRDASEQQLYDSAAARLGKLATGGMTTLEIKSGYGLDLENELKMLRVIRKLDENFPHDIRATFLGAHALPPEYADNRQGYIDLICEQMLPAIAREKLAHAVDGFCENIGFTTGEIRQIFQRAQDLGFALKLHAEQLSHCGGTALAAGLNALSADHLEYVDEAAVKAMAESDMTAVLLPGAFYFLRETKKPPIDLFRKHHVPMAIATDHNPGTSPTLSLPLMMNMAAVLFGLTPEECLRGVTVNAARALGLTDRGILNVGSRADFALWDIDHPAAFACEFGMLQCRRMARDGREVPVHWE
ncbi:imidazolonepropionase [Emcibacter sp.]|uniref:imidazolonepropionase n=1 Tax=Emcibacter sp. TaxID=1979954 RepID=UPI002AA875FC|nr:imidazolonepropionase [Emcibacter sp.]